MQVDAAKLYLTMRKSVWIELVEWCVFALIALFIAGVLIMRGEITSSGDDGSTAPIQSLAE